MGKLLIVKTGKAFETVCERCGDFEDMIMKQSGISDQDVITVPVYRNIMPGNLNKFSAVIITGSTSMVTDYSAWSVNTMLWLKSIIEKNIPILGICFGHQLLGETFRGKVEYRSSGKEFGNVSIRLTQDGKKDPLLNVLPENFTGFVSHDQSITRLPPNAVILAENEAEPFHAVSFGEKIWGVQFHPEIFADAARVYVEKERKNLIEREMDVDAVYDAITENDYGGILLRRFIELAL